MILMILLNSYITADPIPMGSGKMEDNIALIDAKLLLLKPFVTEKLCT